MILRNGFKDWIPASAGMTTLAFAGVTFVGLLLCVHIYLGLGPIKEFAPTYDEAVHLTAGYVYLKTGEYHFDAIAHPPLGGMWSAIPLLFLKPLLPVHHPAWIKQRWTPKEQYPFADTFLYRNRVPFDRMLAWGRFMQLIFSCFLGVAIAIVTFYLGGFWPAMFAALMWSLLPAFLTAGSLITTDLAFALFFFGFFACLLRSDTLWMKMAAGVCLGACFASKYFALAVLPSLVVIFWSKWLEKRKIDWHNCAMIGGIGFLSLAFIYRFTELGTFFEGINQIIARSQAGRSSFLFGRHGTQGWLFYFPFVFLIKTPIPLLICLLAAAGAVVKRKLTLPAVLWIPPLVFFGLACMSKVQIGHRHLLAVYPFVIVIAALAINAWGRPGKWLMLPLGLWLFVGTFRLRPNFITFFNEIVGGPTQGYRYLTDSNIDWGQGLKKLSEELGETSRSEGIYLSYFGVADPHVYGMRYLNVGSDSIVPRVDDTALGIKPTTFAISVTNLQATYYAQKNVFDWLKNYQPVKVIGHALFVYDFSKNPEAIGFLERMRL